MTNGTQSKINISQAGTALALVGGDVQTLALGEKKKKQLERMAEIKAQEFARLKSQSIEEELVR